MLKCTNISSEYVLNILSKYNIPYIIYSRNATTFIF